MREIQLADFINHIETDMGQILKIMKRPMVFEVMLNAYLTQSGIYEGHIWYEEAGIGMKRLITETTTKLSNYSRPKEGDLLLVKKFNDEILCWHTIPEDLNKLFSVIAIVLKNTIKQIPQSTDRETITSPNAEEFQLTQDENYELNEFAENIQHKRFHFEETIDEEQFDSPQKLINEINLRLPEIDVFFKLEIITVTEEVLNFPTSRLSIKYEKMTDQKARQIMGILAAATRQQFHDQEPTLECSIPYYHHRFTGTIPPTTPFPTMCIRKHSSRIIKLDQYVNSGVMTEECRTTIKHWVRNRFNILIAGGTGSGKTTMANSILQEVKKETPQDRVGIIEDTPELQCPVHNHFKFCKSEERDLPALLRTSLRYRPDRIVVGEIRGKEAYVLLKAWMSGHPGGLATIHANGANEATHRFEQCISENPEAGKIPRDQIAYAVNGIISIQKVTVREEKDGHVQYIVKRKVTALRQINGYDRRYDKYVDLFVYRDDSPFEQHDDKLEQDENYLA